MTNLKVLMIGPGLPDAANSGLGIVAEQLRQVLNSKVSLISVEPGDILESSEKDTKIDGGFTEEEIVQDIVRVSVSETLDSYSYFEPVTKKETVSISSTVRKKYEKFTESVVSTSSEFDFDLIYVHDWLGMEAALLLQEESGKPLVLHIHSLDVDRLGANHRSWVYDVERSAIKSADAIITVSEYTKEKIVSEYSADPSKINVVYPALPDFGQEELVEETIDNTVLFLGRFAHQKRPMKFVEIAELVTEKADDVHFLMVGDGDLKTQVIEKVAQKGLGDKIHFSDHIPHNELNKVFGRTSVLCITSDSEPFGLTALEAAAANIPVVLSEQSGVKEVLSGAIVVDKDNISGFADAILKLLSDKKINKSVIEKNKKDLDNLGWESSANAIVEIFRAVVG